MSRHDTLGLLWIDLETTGGDENVDNIIEVGAVVTDLSLSLATDNYFSMVCKPSQYSFERMLDNEVVQKMHERSGLLKESFVSPHNIYDVEARMLDWLKGFPYKDYRLAGSGVSHFDRRFIKRYMRSIDHKLIRGEMDIGVIRRFLRETCAAPSTAFLPDTKNHRAVDDILNHLGEARHFQALVQGAWTDQSNGGR